MKLSAPQKTVASTLALSLTMAAPGLAPYEALAQLVTPTVAGVTAGGASGAAGAVNVPGGTAGITPSLRPATLSPIGGSPQGAPQVVRAGGVAPAAAGNLALGSRAVGTAGELGATLKRSDVRAATLAQGAATPEKAADGTPTTLEAGRTLQTGLSEGPKHGSNGRSGPLERFWTAARRAVAPDVGGLGGAAAPAAEPSEGGLQPAEPGAPKLNAEPQTPVSPETHPQLFEARSSRVGIGPLKYVYWNAYYNIVQWFNLKLAKDPNNRVSWDQWPSKLGLLYLIGKIRFLRSGAVTDPYDYASNDVRPKGAEPKAAKIGYTADGRWVSDRERPRMGAENTRFGSNLPPKRVRGDVESLMRRAREAGKLRWRDLDEHGKPIVKPANILNNLAGGWIQFQFHNFGGNTKRDPITENPHKIPALPKDNWPKGEIVVDRTSKDPTRVTDNGRPTIMNERTQAWIQGQIYGTNEGELNRLRSFEGGKMKLDAKGLLPADPGKPGIDLTGFANNYNPLLSFLHWAFVLNHNNIADHLRKYAKPPTPGQADGKLEFSKELRENSEAEKAAWDDETLFQYARKINVANIAFIHTLEWTEDLLQHPTLQEGMHADWYGLLGPRAKNYLMRFSYRHPRFGRLMKPLTDSDVFWGMPGSRWEHHDGPFQVPLHFRMVYRLHEMVLDEQEILAPPTATLGERRLDNIELIDFVHHNTRPIVEKFGMDVLAYSFARKSAGALVPKNFPRTLTNFKNQQNGEPTDLAMMDLLREEKDGTGSYNEFRRSVGEPPVKSFLELAGGDAEAAKALASKYENVDEVHAGIGLIFEPKPVGFALSYTQFYQFVLNAPRRVKSNRHMTEFFNHKDYTFEGMEWVQHSGGMGGVIARAMKGLPHGQAVVDAMEGVVRWFAPWQDTDTFPVRMLDRAKENSGATLKATARTAALGSFTAFTAWMAVAGALGATWLTVPAVAGALAAPILLYYKRMLAYRFMEKTWQSAYTDKRRSMFPTLFLGEKWAAHAASLGRWSARGAALGFGLAAWTLMGSNPIVALLAGLTALSTIPTLKATARYENDMHVLRVALQNRLRRGYPVTTDPSVVPGKTALERRYWFLVPPGAEQAVARASHTYKVLREHGLGRIQSFKTAVLSHLIFGPRTQRGLGIKGRWDAGILFNPFAIYVPNIVKAQGPSTTGIYAPKDNAKGLTPGDVDLEAFERWFGTYAPGRDYMTAYDFARMREGVRSKAAQEGRGNPVTRFLGGIAVKHRTDQLLQLYADVVANEDKKLVPAISREMLLRVYQGTAQVDIMKERALDGIHPDLARPNPVRGE